MKPETFRELIDLYETKRAMADELLRVNEVDPYSRVLKWYARDSIPPEYWPDIVASLTKRGHSLTYEHLVWIAHRVRRVAAREAA